MVDSLIIEYPMNRVLSICVRINIGILFLMTIFVFGMKIYIEVNHDLDARWLSLPFFGVIGAVWLITWLIGTICLFTPQFSKMGLRIKMIILLVCQSFPLSILTLILWSILND